MLSQNIVVKHTLSGQQELKTLAICRDNWQVMFNEVEYAGFGGVFFWGGGGGNCKDIWTGASRKESDLFLHTGSGAPQHISFN